MNPDALLDAALAYARRGWPVFPCRPNGKEPAIAKAAGGNGVLDATTDEAQIRAWWEADPRRNIGIATGAPGPDVIDFDTHDGTGIAAMGTLNKAGLLDGRGWLVRTRSGGWHAYYEGTAQRNGSLGPKGVHVDFRSTGGYVIAPPSYVDDDDGKPAGHYEVIGDHKATAAADWRIVSDLLAPPPAFQQPPAERAARSDDRNWPGDDYNTRADWAQILADAGWRLMRQIGGVRYWQRPGKTGRGISASTRDDGGLWVFSTNAAPFQPETLYSKFGAYAELNHGGDYKAAAAQLRRDDYGAPPALPALSSLANGSAQTPEATQALGLTPIGHLIRDGVPDPEMLPGGLLYVGGIHVIAGEPDSGKTTLALWQALQLLRAGLPVLMLDEESGAEMIAEKLIALGCTEADAALFSYAEFPAQAWNAAGLAQLASTLDTVKPVMVLLDSAAAFLARAGKDENSATDVTWFWANILTPLARIWKAAVTVIDHDVKNGSDESRFSRGSGAKLAASDVMVKVKLVQAFSRDQNGALKLIVTKDRRGWLHRLFDVSVKVGDGLQLSITESESRQPAGVRLSPAESKVLSVADGTPRSVYDLGNRIADRYSDPPLRRPTISTALNHLLELNLVDKFDHGNGRAAEWVATESDGAHP